MNEYQEPRKCHECFWANYIPARIKFECHFNAPSCIHGVGTGESGIMWPIVSPGDFCSMFQYKQQVAEPQGVE